MTYDILYCSDDAAWESWLEANHAASAGIRLAIGKKGGAHPSVTYPQAVETALCFGWIDGPKARLDDDHYLQTFTPRTARSIWSQINRDKALALIESERMRPAGLREIQRAKENGRWDSAYGSTRTAEVPADLASALQANAEASAFFATLSSQNRFAILFRIGTVKRAETRARKIAQYVEMLERHETIYPQRPRS
ncbi:YdeI/OmpD-associated family protein [Microbacterium sp. STN6]|uniref:YdeI/OmpD-associated family protein n=1 Tax=Microbacterium sp. STN6 TaxID=2995588 RepID=UPI00226085E6|nr:YdeI/OmpD-associated family protein [Microbacterium sp. STN6]MCX7523097.1 YdeI/OmpD-associated family protein [Microbacterium sp. STN6]